MSLSEPKTPQGEDADDARIRGASPLLKSTAVILLAAAAVVLSYKRSESTRSWIESHFRFSKEKADPPAEKPADPSHQSLMRRLERVEEETRSTSRRVKILGIAHNENFSSVSEQSGVKDLIMLGHDWKMSSRPKMLEIAEEDRGFVDDNVSR